MSVHMLRALRIDEIMTSILDTLTFQGPSALKLVLSKLVSGKSA